MEFDDVPSMAWHNAIYAGKMGNLKPLKGLYEQIKREVVPLGDWMGALWEAEKLGRFEIFEELIQERYNARTILKTALKLLCGDDGDSQRLHTDQMLELVSILGIRQGQYNPSRDELCEMISDKLSSRSDACMFLRQEVLKIDDILTRLGSVMKGKVAKTIPGADEAHAAMTKIRKELVALRHSLENTRFRMPE